MGESIVESVFLLSFSKIIKLLIGLFVSDFQMHILCVS